MLRGALGVVVLSILGCDERTLSEDAAVAADGGRGDDGGELPDAWAIEEFDAAQTEDSSIAQDAARDPLLSISGSCGVLDDELLDDEAYWVENVSTLPEGFSRANASRLGAGAQTILADGTAGGSSGYSEAFAFEVLERCEGASLVASETMIQYGTLTPGAIADILVAIDGVRVGVSVTRAVTVTGMCARAETYALTTATELLTRKVTDLHEASTLVAPEHAWTKNLIFVYADTTAHAMTMMTAWAGLDAALRADTIVYVSISEDMDAFIYFEDRCG